MKTKTYYIFSQCSKVNHKSKCRSISKLFDGKIKLLEQNFCEKSGVRINMIDTVYATLMNKFNDHFNEVTIVLVLYCTCVHMRL